MPTLTDELLVLARNDVDYELRRTQNRHTHEVSTDWERSISGPIVDLLVSHLSPAAAAHADAGLRAPRGTQRLTADTVGLIASPTGKLPPFVPQSTARTLTARVRDLLASAGPSDADAHAWAPAIVQGCGSLVMGFLLGAHLNAASAN